MTAAFITHADCLKHEMGAHHPERPERLWDVMVHLDETGIASQCVRPEWRPVSRERLCALLWDAPNDPRGELRWCLSKARAVLDQPGPKPFQHRAVTHPTGLQVEAALVRHDGLAGVVAIVVGDERVDLDGKRLEPPTIRHEVEAVALAAADVVALQLMARTVLLVDARHGLKPVDRELMGLLAQESLRGGRVSVISSLAPAPQQVAS